MALTRKALVAMGIGAEQIDQIIEMHTETVEGLKAERDNALKDAKKYKTDADKLAEVQTELDNLKKDGKTDKYEEKYNDLKAEFDKYKGEQEEKETKATKTAAYKKLLKDAGVSTDRLEWALDHAKNIDALEFDENREVKNKDDILKGIKEEFDAFITTSGEMGAKTATPPANSGGKMSKTDILKIENDTERQRAIAENHELFGF